VLEKDAGPELLYIWGRVEREWGHEIRADFTDSSGKIYNETMVFNAPPTTADIESRVVELRQQIESRKEIIDGDNNF
jgi:hypothetical protein